MKRRTRRSMPRTAGLLVAALGILTLACTANIDSQKGGASGPSTQAKPSAGSSGGAPGSANPTQPGATAAMDKPGPIPLRRLTREELANTLRDLLGDDTGAAKALAPDGRGAAGFLEAGSVSAVDVEHLLEMVERVGATLPKKLPALIGCDPAAGAVEDTCARGFFTKFGRRAYRRPLADSEVATLLAYFKEVKTKLGYGFFEAMRMAIEGMLLAPSFLYHWELGPLPARQEPGGAGLVRLGPHETASRLSYFAWASMPDDALFAAADAGRLASPEDVEREIRRLLGDAKARATIARFHAEWLELDKIFDVQKDPKKYPEWNAELARAMADETAAFVTRTILDGDGSLKTLLTSSSSFVNTPLAKVYGATSQSVRELVAAPLDPAQRAGLFTHGSFLAVNASALSSHPVKRGHRVYSDVLCGPISSPPDMVPPVDAPPANMSTREIFEQHGQNACARACHALLDPLGYGFENYDAIGRYRTTDGGKPVNATGMLRSLSTGEVKPFRNAVELAAGLAVSEDVRHCVATQWLRFGLGRVEVPGDEASLAGAYAAFAKSGHNVRELLVALARTRSFLYRTAAAGEVLR